MRAHITDEFEQFRQDINLASYAHAQGYVPINEQIISNNYVLMQGQNKKIIITTNDDLHGVYTNINDYHDCGTIIDFLHSIKGFNSKEILQELRPWIGKGETTISTKNKFLIPRPWPSTDDTLRVIQQWLTQCHSQDTHKYFTDLGIESTTLRDKRFASVWKVDQFDNIAFPHFYNDQLTGYDITNRSFNGFSKNGEKGLWESTNIKTAKNIFITESPTEALSHAQLHPDPQAAYISIGDHISGRQKRLLMLKLSGIISKNKEVIIATDNDIVGHGYCGDILEIAPEAQRTTPTGVKWSNDLLEGRSMNNESYNPTSPNVG